MRRPCYNGLCFFRSYKRSNHLLYELGKAVSSLTVFTRSYVLVAQHLSLSCVRSCRVVREDHCILAARVSHVGERADRTGYVESSPGRNGPRVCRRSYVERCCDAEGCGATCTAVRLSGFDRCMEEY